MKLQFLLIQNNKKKYLIKLRYKIGNPKFISELCGAQMKR